MLTTPTPGIPTEPWHVELARYPTWICQFDLRTDDQQPPEDAQLSCWAACCSGIIYHRTGTFYFPDTVKDVGLGQGKIGGGSTLNITRALVYYQVPSSVMTPAGRDALLRAEYTHLMKGHACIVDQHLHYPDNPQLHWRTVIGQIGHGYTVDTVVLHDPETGERVEESVDRHLQMAYQLAPGQYLLDCEEA